MPESFAHKDAEAEIARLVLQAGLATPQQLEDARKLVEQMKGLGVQRDLLGALVDRKVIDRAKADDIRARAAPQAGAEVEDAEELEAEIVDDEGEEEGGLKLAPEYRPSRVVRTSGGPDRPGMKPAAGPAGPAAPSAAFCCNHPDRPAVASCGHCGRPVCVHCVIRTEKGAFCSEACAVGSVAAFEAKSVMGHKSYDAAVKLGRYIRWVAVVAILLGVAWVVKLFVDDYRVSFALQKAQFKGDTSKEGMAALRKAVRLRPRRADLRVRLGTAYRKTGDAGLAIKELELAMKYDPKSSTALHAAADAYAVKGMHEETAGALLELRAIGAADSDSELRLGVVFRDRLGNPAGAIEAFRRAQDLGSESRELHYEIGAACFAEGSFAEAKKELSKAVAPLESDGGPGASRDRTFLKDTEKMTRAYSLLIEVVEKEGDAAALDTVLARARAALPRSAPLALRRAKLLVNQKKPKEALAALDASYKHLSGDPEYLSFLAELQTETGAPRKAVMTLRRLREVAPTRPGVLERLVNLEASVGDPLMAMKLLQSLPADRRGSEELLGVWENLIRNQLSRGRVTSARRMLENLGPKAERDPRFAPVWCEVLHRLGRDKEALERAELVLRREPKNPVPHLVVGSVLRSLGRTREALERIRTAEKLGAGGGADIEMGLLYWNGGLKNEASRRFNKALADPKLSTMRKREASGYLARIRGAKARQSHSSHVVELLHSKLRPGAVTAERAVTRIRLATYGATHVYGMLAGAVGLDPVGNEIETIRTMSIVSKEGIDPRTLMTLQTESDKMAEDASRALKSMYPRAAPDIARAMAEYRRRQRSAGDKASNLGASATWHLMTLYGGLGHHPRAAEIRPVLDMALRKMKARGALAPGALQEAIAADLAAVDMLAAAIGVGPGSFVFEAAVRGVLSDVAAADAEAADPLSQFTATRRALFRMLWLFTAQAREMGSVSELSTEAKGGLE